MPKCEQCGKEMNPVEAIINPVCGKCCRANHKAIVNGTWGKQDKKKK